MRTTRKSSLQIANLLAKLQNKAKNFKMDNPIDQIVKSAEGYYIIFSRKKIFKTINDDDIGIENIKDLVNNKINLTDANYFSQVQLNDVKNDISNIEIMGMNPEYDAITLVTDDQNNETIVGIKSGEMNNLTSSISDEDKQRIENMNNLFIDDGCVHLMNTNINNISQIELEMTTKIVNSGNLNVTEQLSTDYSQNSKVTKPNVMTYNSITLEGDPIIYGDYTYKQYKLTDSKNENYYLIYQIENSNPKNVKEVCTLNIKPFEDQVERFGLTYFDPNVFNTIDKDYDCFTITKGNLEIKTVRCLHMVDKETFKVAILQFGENTIKVYRQNLENNSITGIYTDVKYRLCEFINTSSRECVLVNFLHNSGTALSDGKIATIYVDLSSAVIYKLTSPHVNGSIAAFKFSEHSVSHTIFYKNPVSDDEIITTVSGYGVLYTCSGGFFVTTNNLTSSYAWTGPTKQFTSNDWNYTRNTSPSSVSHSWHNASCRYYNSLFDQGTQRHTISCTHHRQTVYNSSGSKIWGYERHDHFSEYKNGNNTKCGYGQSNFYGSCDNVRNNYNYYAWNTNGDTTKTEKDITTAKDDYPFNPIVIYTSGLNLSGLGGLGLNYPNTINPNSSFINSDGTITFAPGYR